MKNILLSVFLIFLNIKSFADYNADSAFSAANKSYIDGNYSEAVQIYETIIAEGYSSGELYYNLGNAYYKLSLYPKAILNYEKALLISPKKENYRFNLEKSRIYIVDKIDEVPEFIFRRWWNSAVTLFSSDLWSIISLISFVIGITGLLVFFLTSRMRLRRTAFYSAILVLLISLASLGMARESKKLLTGSNSGIVMTPSVTIKGAPSNTGTDLFILHEGTKVYVVDELDQWYEIKISDGKQGWLQKSDIELI